MIEQALHVLMLHILWKTKGLIADSEPMPEDIRYKEVLQEQREALLEKLVEYAVGTQSNTVEGVKRAVRFMFLYFVYKYLLLNSIWLNCQAFKHLLDLHVLFSSSNAVSPEGNPLPIASLALTLDDEVQYRCAGYIQAEIERYAEFLDDENEDEEDKSDGSDEQEDAEGDKVPKQSKTKKAKKAPKEGLLSSLTRTICCVLTTSPQSRLILEIFWNENISSLMLSRRFSEQSAVVLYTSIMAPSSSLTTDVWKWPSMLVQGS